MKAHLNPWFYIPFVVIAIAAGILLYSIERGEDVLFINSYHSSFFDHLFYYGTTLGNGLLYLAVGLAFMLKNFRYSVIAILCFAVTGIFVQVLKVTVFDDVMRPSIVLAGHPLHFVEGVKLLSRNSFPSGHTTTAFSMFCLLSLMVKEKKWALPFLFMALIGGISRIYLVQHFFVDVYFGAIIGVTFTSIIWLWFMKTNALQRWENRSVLAVLRNP